MDLHLATTSLSHTRLSAAKTPSPNRAIITNAFTKNIIPQSFRSSPLDVALVPRNGVIIFPAGTQLNFDKDGDGHYDSIRTTVSYTYHKTPKDMANIPEDYKEPDPFTVALVLSEPLFNELSKANSKVLARFHRRETHKTETGAVTLLYGSFNAFFRDSTGKITPDVIEFLKRLDEKGSSHYKLISLLKENVVNFDGVIGTMKDPWQTAIYKNHLITENKTPGLFPHGMMQHSQVDELLENKKKMAAVSIGPTVPTVATGPEGMDTELKKAARTIKEFAERMERDGEKMSAPEEIKSKESTAMNALMKVFDKSKEIAAEGAMRGLSRKALRKAKNGILAMMKKRNVDSMVIEGVSSFLQTDAGEGMLSIIIGICLINVPKINQNEFIVSLSEEMMKEGGAKVVGDVFDLAMDMVMPIINEILNDKDIKARLAEEKPAEADDEETEAATSKTASVNATP